ncbi:MAG: cell filamentation protein Fic, partial [Geobacteraceae bacterium]|nr:cell filamentation protein Fic [Geobacteraceae bacterium]
MALNRVAGYIFLTEKYKLNVIPNWHISLISPSATKNAVIQDGRVETTYPQSYWPGDSTLDHLEFALKYDGINLAILAELFQVIDTSEITTWVASKQTGKYVRKIWFLYELLTGTPLPLPDLAQGNYIDLLEKQLYYTITPGQRIQRQRVVNNLLGNAAFCPMIRRTEKLSLMGQIDILKRCMDIVTVYPPELLQRALNYLYTKETRSSYKIEHLTPSASRTEKFIRLLSTAEHRDYCEKAQLIDAQNSIVDPRFHDADYRTIQNYIGETISFQKQRVHYVCPKPEHIEALMAGLISTHKKLKQQDIPAVVHAAIISYGFVFMHPFEDGNGRIHRFLIHNILSQRKAVPEGLMFPVSASMLKNLRLYTSSLEAYSTPLLQLIDYELDDNGYMTVSGDTRILYAYIDMTAQAEALYDFIMKTIDEELREELDFLVSYDRVKSGIQDIVDMPDMKINLFIRLCLQNH